ncbi:hypothetical protein O181_003145 [Austropuccinia psidii MF-1]|uniref:Integrase catalytic domain-containing protein n=1 Tax=Austropuccinia psidii MF-1 TaxID=1389203 RepID=A0A9Q3BDU7_9BASI|nr:hypothetical protein [Austropuccinia psidii MF-1]
MTIVHKSGRIHNNSDGLSRWELSNTPGSPSYVPANSELQIPMKGINITAVGKKFFEEVIKSYRKDKNFNILTSLLENNCKDTSLANSLDDVWKTSYENGIFHSFYGILYHSDRELNLTSALWTNLHKLLGKKISFSTAYHLQTDVFAERMIQTLEDIIRRFCAYFLKHKDSYGFTHDWCTLIPELELAYKTAIHAATGKTPAMFEKGWNPKLPADTLKKD